AKPSHLSSSSCLSAGRRGSGVLKLALKRQISELPAEDGHLGDAALSASGERSPTVPRRKAGYFVDRTLTRVAHKSRKEEFTLFCLDLSPISSEPLPERLQSLEI